MPMLLFKQLINTEILITPVQILDCMVWANVISPVCELKLHACSFILQCYLIRSYGEKTVLDMKD